MFSIVTGDPRTSMSGQNSPMIPSRQVTVTESAAGRVAGERSSALSSLKKFPLLFLRRAEEGFLQISHSSTEAPLDVGKPRGQQTSTLLRCLVVANGVAGVFIGKVGMLGVRKGRGNVVLACVGIVDVGSKPGTSAGVVTGPFGVAAVIVPGMT